MQNSDLNVRGRNNQKLVYMVGKLWGKHPYNPVAGGRREECLFVVDEEKIRLALVERSCEIVWFGAHYVLW